MENEPALELYHEHYKDTYELNRAAQTRRNRNFVLLCVLEAISFMLVYNPTLICGVLSETIRAKVESAIVLSNTTLQTLVWILIAYVTVRYVQDVLYVERLYPYIECLEERMTGLTEDEFVFCREGKHYSKDYPVVLNLIHLFYNAVCPILFMGINVAHIIQEWRCGVSIVPLLIDSTVCFAILVIAITYFFEIHKGMTKWCRFHIPGFAWVSDNLKRILKGV